MENNNNNESKIRKILRHEFTTVILMVSIVVTVIFFIIGPDNKLQQDVALINKDIEYIKNNHLMHIQYDITDIKDDIYIYDQKLNSINIKLERVLTLLGE